jgi:xanthine/uracil permease
MDTDKTALEDSTTTEQSIQAPAAYAAGDKGFASRKFAFSVATSVLISLGAILVAYKPGFAGSYPIFIGGVSGTLGLYLSGNVMSKQVVGNHLVKMNKDNQDPKA